ncbi:MAG: 50S ribosomal protein L13 [Candidatus Colwellbacteria bacterium]|nr:50S ribosomal protein L13 [Candidatus Colwellbacteria bacterium]
MEHIIDAKNETLGRLASKIAVLLQGKEKPTYDPKDAGDVKVIVKNIKLIKVSGRKAKGDGKVYYRHTGYMGHIKEETYEELFKRQPAEVLRRAVYNMLPKNRLRQKRMNMLKIGE